MSNSLETLLTIDPYDEDSVLELMEIYCNMGQPTKALIFFKEYSSKIENKMGITPSERSKNTSERSSTTGQNTTPPPKTGKVLVQEKRARRDDRGPDRSGRPEHSRLRARRGRYRARRR